MSAATSLITWKVLPCSLICHVQTLVIAVTSCHVAALFRQSLSWDAHLMFSLTQHCIDFHHQLLSRLYLKAGTAQKNC